jgi:PKD repeat protein
VQKHYTDSGRTVAVPPTPTDAYGKAVYTSGPDVYWRLGESAGAPGAVDSSGNDRTGTYGSGVSLGAPGALSGVSDTAVTVNGSQAGIVVAPGPVGGPSTYSAETLFKTTSASGGKVIGFGGSPSGDSGAYDRHVYMTDDGRLVFGTWTGSVNTAVSTASYNDGQWHHLVATQGVAGMVLYVDGAQVASNPQTSAQDYGGYWRVGGDNLNGWPMQPSSGYFNGAIDEVAIYPTQLTATQVQAHWTRTGLTPPPPNQLPTAAFTSSCTALGCTFDGSGSADPDGSIASYAWTYGDGDTGSGPQPSHTYPFAGDFTVTLAVTDDSGATASVSHVVSPRPAANPPPVVAADAFGRTATNGFGTADTGGAWTVSSTAANYTVSGGAGRMVLPAAAAQRWAYLTGVSRTEADGAVTLTADKAATGGGLNLSLVGRRVAANTEYRARVRVLSTGAVALGVTRLAGTTTETLVGSELTVPGLTAAAGTPLRVRFAVTGTNPTTLRAKVGLAGTAEPAAWQIQATDSTAALQAAGGVGVYTYLSGSATNSPVTVSVDDLEVSAGNSPPTASFTASCTALDCSVDASASTDAEGPLSYRWSFADGGTATGATASHSYGSAGTYRITLTVMDAAGATDVTTRTVTVA